MYICVYVRMCVLFNSFIYITLQWSRIAMEKQHIYRCFSLAVNLHWVRELSIAIFDYQRVYI